MAEKKFLGISLLKAENNHVTKPHLMSLGQLKTPSFRVDGKVALIAGAGRGIGAASALALSDAGARVILVARSRDQLDAVAREIKDRGGVAESLVLDVTDPVSVRSSVESLGPIDILVNSAGTNRPALLTESVDEDIDAVVGLNIKAAFFLAREVSRKLIADSKSGSIIQISSQMGHVGGPKRTLYCATKHAIEGMTKALAWELGPYGIRVNTVCPTFIETAMTAPMLAEPGFREYVCSKIALGRIGRLEDIMGAVVFLAADVSSLVTGSALMVDGGWTAA